MKNLCYYCYALRYLVHDFTPVDLLTSAFVQTYSIESLEIANLKASIDISASSLLKKSSILYIINNASPTDSITITLSAYCYNKYSEDPDIVSALEKQPLVTLASA